MTLQPKDLVAHWRAEGNADSTIDRNLRALWPAFDRGARDKLMLATETPLRITAEDWNPQGRQQTDKHGAIVPLGPVALAEIKNWTRTAETVLEYNGAPLATNEFFDTLLAEAGVEDCSPKTIRHTVRTWLAEHDIDDKRADLFRGHDRPEGQGSRTGAKYLHLKPSYLAGVREAVDDLFVEPQPLIRGRGLGGYRGVDQPSPDDPATLAVLANCLPSAETVLVRLLQVSDADRDLERETRLELATPTLARTGDPSKNSGLASQNRTSGASPIKDLRQRAWQVRGNRKLGFVREDALAALVVK